MSKKCLVVFEIHSQDKLIYEGYEISGYMKDKASELGRALVIWFNMTGGNSDGTYRKFSQVVYNEVVSESEYEEKPFVSPVTKFTKGFSSFRFLGDSINGSNHTDLLKLEPDYGGGYQDSNCERLAK